MKNRKKGLLIALVLLLVVAAAYYAIVKVNQASETDDEASENSLVISSVDSDQIMDISYEKDGKKLSFVKENGTWYYESDRKFPVLQDSLTAMTNQLGAISAVRKLEEPEALSEYGLEEPVLTIHYEANDNKTADFIVGDTNSSVGGCYFQIGGDNAVYIVSSDFKDAFISDLYEMADMGDFPTIVSDDITSVKIESGEQALQLTTDGNASSGWIVTENGEKKEDCSSTSITQLINTVTGITFKKDIEYNCQDMSVYGLENPTASVTVDYTETVTVDEDSEAADKEDGDETETEAETETKTVTVAKQVVVYIGGQNEDGDYYVSMDGSNEVQLLSASTAEQLMSARAADMVDSAIISGTLSEAAGIEITTSSGHWKLEKKTVVVEAEDGSGNFPETEGSGNEEDGGVDTAEETEAEPETEVKWYVGSKEIQLVDLSGAYSDLSQMRAEKILGESTEPKGEETVSITLRWDDGKENVITFTEHDSSFQLATVDGEGRKLVNRRDVEKLIEDFEELLQ